MSRKRVGAICKDGTRTSATGRGAGSWHGGVKEWIYEPTTTKSSSRGYSGGYDICEFLYASKHESSRQTSYKTQIKKIEPQKSQLCQMKQQAYKIYQIQLTIQSQVTQTKFYKQTIESHKLLEQSNTKIKELTQSINLQKQLNAQQQYLLRIAQNQQKKAQLQTQKAHLQSKCLRQELTEYKTKINKFQQKYEELRKLINVYRQKNFQKYCVNQVSGYVSENLKNQIEKQIQKMQNMRDERDKYYRAYKMLKEEYKNNKNKEEEFRSKKKNRLDLRVFQISVNSLKELKKFNWGCQFPQQQNEYNEQEEQQQQTVVNYQDSFTSYPNKLHSQQCFTPKEPIIHPIIHQKTLQKQQKQCYTNQDFLADQLFRAFWNGNFLQQLKQQKQQKQQQLQQLRNRDIYDDQSDEPTDQQQSQQEGQLQCEF